MGNLIPRVRCPECRQSVVAWVADNGAFVPSIHVDGGGVVPCPGGWAPSSGVGPEAQGDGVDNVVQEHLEREEREGLTIWGDSISAQVRDGELGIHFRPDARRDPIDGLVMLTERDVIKLEALIRVAREVKEI